MKDETPLRRWMRWHEGEIVILFFLVMIIAMVVLV